MLDSWNEKKMDALEAEISAVDAKVNALAARMERGFSRVNADLREQRRTMEAGFERVDDCFERMYRLLIQFCSVAIAGLIILIGTQL